MSVYGIPNSFEQELVIDLAIVLAELPLIDVEVERLLVDVTQDEPVLVEVQAESQLVEVIQVVKSRLVEDEN